MLVITNRNIVRSRFQDGIGDERAFGEQANSKGPSELRLAHATKEGGRWQVRLVQEPRTLRPGNLPSKREFDALRTRLVDAGWNCVFFVHGFSQSFADSIERGLAIETRYGVEAVVFSWPSNPGGFKLTEYRDAKRAAKASSAALDSALEKLGGYLKEPFNAEALRACDVRFSFMAYSLGNFLFKNYVRDAEYEGETNVFENVVLCQADVDLPGHETWVERIVAGKRVYVTINENDWVLKWSDANFQQDRLGRTARDLVARNANYVDFTGGPDVGNTHGVFHRDTNAVVRAFFQATLNGERGELVDGLRYDERRNAFRF